MAFNKMFVMLPVMLAARKLDGEDPQVSIIYRPGEDGGFAGYENPAARNHTHSKQSSSARQAWAPEQVDPFHTSQAVAKLFI